MNLLIRHNFLVFYYYLFVTRERERDEKMREIFVAWRWSGRGKDERVVGGLKLKNNKIPLNMAIKATDINLSFLTHVLITSSIRRRFHVEQKHTQKVRRWMERKKIGRIPFFRMKWGGVKRKVKIPLITLTNFENVHQTPRHNWYPMVLMVPMSHDWDNSSQLSTKLFYSKHEKLFFPSLSFPQNFHFFLFTLQLYMARVFVLLFWILERWCGENWKD